MRRLSAKDTVQQARLKLRGTAKSFYTAQSELRADDITYVAFRTAFVNRFKDKHTDQYNYTSVMSALLLNIIYIRVIFLLNFMYVFIDY